MEKQELYQEFLKKGAILNGHFLLSSGLHSSTYLQCALILQYPWLAEEIAKNLVEELKINPQEIDVVVSPAIGGIVIGQEVGRVLGKRAIFCEREDNVLKLRRGFTLNQGERALVIEDVLTTGKSIQEILRIVEENQGITVAIGVIFNRAIGKINFKVPLKYIFEMEIENYQQDMCPLCKQGIPLEKPGSKKW